jgi:hypothetical protein
MKETRLNDLVQQDTPNLDELVTDNKTSQDKSQDVDAVSSSESLNSDAICDICNGVITLQNDELFCSGCGIIKTVNSDIMDDHERIITYRIKIIGKDGGQFQHDLDRSAPVNETVIRKESILRELMTLNLKYIDKGGNAIPNNALKRAADYYNQIQEHYIKRGSTKQMILVSLIYKSCLECGFYRDKTDITNFAQLPTNAISKGDTVVRKAIAEGKIDTKLMDDTSHPHIETIFEKLSEIINASDAPKYKGAVAQIIKIAEKNGICANNQMKSKVAAMIVFIMQHVNRHEDAGKIMSKIDVRPNTIKKIIGELNEYYEYFEAIVEKLVI